MFVRTSKPTQDDYDNLPLHELKSSYPHEPESNINIEPSQRRIPNKKLRKIRRNLKKTSTLTSLPISEWHKRLAGEPIDVMSKIL